MIIYTNVQIKIEIAFFFLVKKEIDQQVIFMTT